MSGTTPAELAAVDQAGGPAGSAAFASLEAQAGALDGAAQAIPVAPAPPPSNNAAELEGALQLARMMCAPMLGWWPDFERVWGDRTLQGISQAGGAVMDKHGWTVSSIMGEYGPYIALVGATAPPAWVTWQAIKAKRAELEQQQKAARERPQQAAH